MSVSRFLRFVAPTLLALGCSKNENDPPRPSASASAAPAALPSASVATADAAPAPEKSQPKRPYNVVLIMIDSMRADMPWAGYPRDIAPWLTKFQKEHCVSYPSGYSISSYTAKSVAPALVGKYPSEMPRDGYFFTKWPDDNLFVSERAQQAGHRTLAGHAHGYFMPLLGNNQGFDDYRLIPGSVDLKAVTSVTSDKLTKLAKEMLSEPENTKLDGDKRFFAYFHYLDPHHTYEKHPGHPDYGNKPRDLYDNEIHWTDHWVGQLVDWARQQPWAEQTAFIITADHGEGFGEHGHFRHSYELWESLVRVPLMVCIPGVAPRTIEVRRGHVDLAPTIADLMGVKADPPFRGQSLLPEVFGQTPAKPRHIVVDLPRSDLMDRRRGVISEDGYKIIAFGNDNRFELYNLEKDPAEEHELSEKEPDELEAMKKLYERISKQIPNVEVTGGAELKGAPKGQRW